MTSWTVACQAPLSMGFSRQEYWSGLLFPSLGDLPNPGIEPRSPALQADSSLTELRGSPFFFFSYTIFHFQSIPRLLWFSLLSAEYCPRQVLPCACCLLCPASLSSQWSFLFLNSIACSLYQDNRHWLCICNTSFVLGVQTGIRLLKPGWLPTELRCTFVIGCKCILSSQCY